MKKNLFISGKYLPVFLLVSVLFTTASCRLFFPLPKSTIKNYINWNLVFKPGTDSAARVRIINDVKNQVNRVNSDSVVSDTTSEAVTFYLYRYLLQRLGNNIKWHLTNAQDHYCSCKDTLLWNLTADLIYEVKDEGGSPPTPPPPPDRTKIQEGSIEYLDQNSQLNSPEHQSVVIDEKNPFRLANNPQFSDDAILGIIDTGIDTLLFDTAMRRQMFAYDGNRILSINVIPTGTAADSGRFGDDMKFRHGSAVASIALQAAYDAQKSDNVKLPKLMIIKALDENGNGNTLTLSCALSYAVRNHASVANVSLGYTGGLNAVLQHYLRLAAKNNLPVIAAAGNTEGPRDHGGCDSVINKQNLLGPGKMVYPACHSVDGDCSVLSVTGMQSQYVPCYYQYYSEKYVTFGVQHKLPYPAPCCTYQPSFIVDGAFLEGSSFATPVISGKIVSKMLSPGRMHLQWQNYLPLTAGLAPNPYVRTFLTY